MKILKGNYGECRFCDNMDPEFGLPSLTEKSWDLCLTDIPFNLTYDGIENRDTHKKEKKNKGMIVYEDSKENNDYVQWCKNLKTQMLRIAKRVILFIGRQNLQYWITDPNLKDIGVWIKRDSNGYGTSFWVVKHEFFITFGEWNNKYRMPLSFYDCNVGSGFNNIEGLIHPCPRPSKLYEMIMSDLKCESVIDCCLGSGTTSQSAEKLGVNWLGYEIMEEYIPDIEKRIKLGIKAHESYVKQKHKQSKLF
jgi:DNA modification methylase